MLLQWETYGAKAPRSAQERNTLQKSSTLLEQAQQRFAPTPPVRLGDSSLLVALPAFDFKAILSTTGSARPVQRFQSMQKVSQDSILCRSRQREGRHGAYQQ